jgi:hypothetical protein
MSKTQQLINEYTESQNKIQTITTQKKSLEKYRQDEIHALKYKVYGPQIDALQSRLNREVSELEQLSEKEQSQKTTEIKSLLEPQKKIERVLAFLKLRPEKVQPITKEMLTLRHGKTLEDLGLLINDEYLSISLFIVSNEKPVNCYSLVAMGHSLFYKYRLDYPFIITQIKTDSTSWQNAVYVSGGNSPKLDLTIKTSSDIDSLKVWADKNRSKILKEFIEEYQKVKAEYLEVLANYTIEQFKPVLQVYCPKCGWFISKFEDYGQHWINELKACENCGTPNISKIYHIS